MTRLLICSVLAMVVGAQGPLNAQGSVEALPHLEKRGAATQLIVKGEPFLALAGEAFNSSTSSLEYVRPLWPKWAGVHMNTILAPVSWEIVEPEEGRFDFSVVDGLIRDARRNHLHLGLLWFGTWKNMVSTYAPAWVRSNPQRFPWAEDAQGRRLPILSTFGEETRKADARAFAALLAHVRSVDAVDQTVIMVQVENEVGISGGRDYSAAARAAFAKPVPSALLGHMQSNRSTLIPDLAKIWQAAGGSTTGSWEAVFGAGGAASEAFMTWNYAQYIGQVIEAGKARYPLPMFVNAALGRSDGKLGTYPSGGPMPLFMDIWRVAAPKLDILSPDIYAANFEDWAARYTQSGNPLFVPETRADAANTFLAFGKYKAIGISPFGIDRMSDTASAFARAYATLASLAPMILEGQRKGTMTAALLDAAAPKQKLSLGAYVFDASLGTGRLDRAEQPAQEGPRGYVLVIALSNDEFLLAGNGALITVAPGASGAATAAFASVEEGSYAEGRWVPGRRLNGDEIMLNYDFGELAAQNQTGTGLRLARGDGPQLLRVKLFRY